MAKRKHKQNGSTQNGSIKSPETITTTGSKPVIPIALQACGLVAIGIAAFIVYKTDRSSNSSPSLSSQPSVTTSDSLNWRPASIETLQKYGSSVCTVDRRTAASLTAKEFEQNYRHVKPVIVTFPNGAKDWTNPAKWSLSSLKHEYGQWSILSGNSREIVRRGGNGDVETSFTEFVDSLMRDTDTVGEPFYVFDRSFYNDSSLPKTLKPPKYFQIRDGVDDSIFFLGASKSGVTFHKHADAWNGVIYGQKRWFLYPSTHTPPGGVYPGYTQMEWYEQIYPKLTGDDKPMECVQEAGEILYLPEGTYHGTINLGDTVAIGIQKKTATLQTEKLFYKELNLEQELPGERRNKLLFERAEIFTKLKDLLPGSSEVMMKLGQALFDIGRQSEGLKYTQAAIDKDPYFIIAHLNKAKMLIKQERYVEAEKILVFVLTMNDRLWDVYATYGDFLMTTRRYKEAITMFKKGTDLQPTMIPFWMNLKIAQQKSGDRKAARETEVIIERLERERQQR